MTEPSLSVGDVVTKTGGDYRFHGTVVSAFRKLSGSVRVVVENADGILHIFSEQHLTLVARVVTVEVSRLDKLHYHEGS